MTKQRRPSKPTKASAHARSVRPPNPAEPERAADVPPPQEIRQPAASARLAPQRRTTYFEAVALYEHGLEALQRHEYERAANLFNSVLRQYPEERSCTSASAST